MGPGCFYAPIATVLEGVPGAAYGAKAQLFLNGLWLKGKATSKPHVLTQVVGRYGETNAVPFCLWQESGWQRKCFQVCFGIFISPVPSSFVATSP